METIVKKYFWTVNLLFLALGAWLLAGTFNVVVAHKLRPVPSFAKSQKTKAKPRKASKLFANNSQVVVDRNYFGSALADPIPEDGGDSELDEADLAPGEEGELSDLRASLVGTVVASDPAWSVAMITDLTASETGVYGLKDDLMDEAKIVAILSRKVVISRGGVAEYLELQEKAKPKNPSSYAKRHNKKKKGKDTLGEGIRKTGKDQWTIARSEIDKTLGNLNNIAMQARIVPSFKNGQSNGFKLFAIRPGSLYGKLGIQNGDIIHKINGYAINSPDKALEIYQKLKSARGIDIELTRRGKSKNLNYKID